MDYFFWEAKYSVNNQVIDAQHRKILESMSVLHNAMVNGTSKEVLGGIIATLNQYTLTHFATEEKLLEAHKYPTLAGHKAEHELFIKKVFKFQEDFQDGVELLNIKIMDFLKDWWIQHILVSDKQYANFLSLKGIE